LGSNLTFIGKNAGCENTTGLIWHLLEKMQDVKIQQV
jgi:hypothetical protein